MISVNQSGDSSLVARIAAAPHLQTADEAPARVKEWLAEIAGLPAGKTLTRLAAAHPRLEVLMTGLADGSPYLWGLVRESPERFVALLEAEPEHRFRDILADARRAIAATRDEAEVMRLLRHMKAEAALLIALADIGGVWPVTQLAPRLITCSRPRSAAASSKASGAALRRKVRAISCSPWVKWGRASSIIRAISTSSSSTIRQRSSRQPSRRHFMCGSREFW